MVLKALLDHWRQRGGIDEFNLDNAADFICGHVRDQLAEPPPPAEGDR